jgi:hypothetical protein
MVYKIDLCNKNGHYNLQQRKQLEALGTSKLNLLITSSSSSSSCCQGLRPKGSRPTTIPLIGRLVTYHRENTSVNYLTENNVLIALSY